MAPFIEAYFDGPREWLIIGVIVLLLFGGAKIPQLAKGLGEGIREFKRSLQITPWAYDDRRGGDHNDGTRGSSKRDALIVACLLLIIAGLLALVFVV